MLRLLSSLSFASLSPLGGSDSLLVCRLIAAACELEDSETTGYISESDGSY